MSTTSNDSETRTETTVTKRLLRITEIKILRITTTGFTQRVRQRNDIRAKCDTEDVVGWIRRNQWDPE